MVEKALTGKVALVTGASSKRGMGRAIALRLAQAGAKVVVIDKFAAPKSFFPGDEGWRGLDEVVKEIQVLGSEALAVVADIVDSRSVNEAVDKAIQTYGQIDIMVNCAGIRGPVGVPVAEGNEADWRIMFDINTIGPFIISKAVAKEMIRRNQGGKIVHIASAAGRLAAPGSAAYAASKWAVIGLVKTLALELAKYKINVNAINPGFFVTNLRDDTIAQKSKETGVSIEKLREDEYKMITDKLIPLGRMGTVEDITRLVYFLVTPESDYMTGQDINITGGHLM